MRLSMTCSKVFTSSLNRTTCESQPSIDPDPLSGLIFGNFFVLDGASVGMVYFDSRETVFGLADVQIMIADFPMSVMKNIAFVHNDWTEMDTPVFEIFSDRLEVTSYGSLMPA